MRRLRWALLFAFCFGAGAWADDPPPLLAGFGVVDITPTKPVPLAGYAERFGRLSTGVRDPVKARAMVLSSGETKIAIVSVDLYSVSRDLKAAVVDAVKSRGFTSANLLLAATNNHSGPGGLSNVPLFRPIQGPFDPDLLATTAKQIATAVEKADDDRRPGSLAPGWPGRDDETFGGPDPAFLRPVRAVRFVKDSNGAVRGVVVLGAARRSILEADDLEISADWQGAMCEEIERSLPGATALFLPTALGRGSRVREQALRRGAIEGYGRLLADQATSGMPGGRTRTDVNRRAPMLASEVRPVALPPTIAGGLLGRDTGGTLVPPREITAEIQILNVVGERWIALPGEPTATVAKEVAPEVLSAFTIACANDDLGVLADRESLRRGEEDADRAFFGPALAARLRAACRPEPRPTDPWLETGRPGASDGAIQIGVAHGRLYRDGLLDLLAHAEDMFVAEATEKGATATLAPAASAMGLWPKDLVLPSLVLAARRMQRHIPPKYLDEMEALAAAAGVPYDSILLENTFLTLAEQTDPSALIHLPAHCTNAALMGVATPLGEPVHVAVLDWGMKDLLRDRAVTFTVTPANEGHSFVTFTWPGMVGTLRAMGAQGISVSEESIAAKDDTGTDGMPIGILLRDVVQNATSLDDAVKRVVEAPGTAGYHVTIVDGHRRDARVIEKTAHHVQVRKPKPDEGRVFGCDPSEGACFDGACDPAVPRTDRSSPARYDAARALFDAAPGQAGARWIAAHLAEAKGVLNDGTLMAVVFEPQVGRYRYALGKDLDPDPATGAIRWTTGMLPSDVREPPPVSSILGVVQGEPQRLGAAVRIPVSFDSPVKSGIANVDRVNASLFLPAEGEPKGVVIQLPAWKERTLAGETLVAMSLASKGIASFLFPLPGQVDRAPKGTKSGEWTLSPDLSRSREAWLQGMADVAAASAYLEIARGFPPARQGVFGISLGGHVAADCYGAYPERFHAGVFVLVGGDLRSSLNGGSTAKETEPLRNRFANAGVTLDDVADLVRPLDPATWASPARRDGVFMVGARQDPIVPPANVEALSKAYGGAEVLWVDGDHYAAISRASEILEKAAQHLRRRFGGE